MGRGSSEPRAEVRARVQFGAQTTAGLRWCPNLWADRIPAPPVLLLLDCSRKTVRRASAFRPWGRLRPADAAEPLPSPRRIGPSRRESEQNLP